MKVLTYVARLVGYKAAGLEAELYDEIVKLSRRVEKLIVITEEATSRFRDNIEVLVLNIKAPRKVRALLRISLVAAAALRLRERYDVIYVRTFAPAELLMLWLARKLLKVKAILLIPGTWLFEEGGIRSGLAIWALRKAVSASDLVVLYSPLMLKSLIKYVPNITSRRLLYIRNAVNLERFKPKPPKPGLIEELGVKGHKVVLYVGRLTASKGVEDLLKAFSKLLNENKYVKLIIVGEGDSRYVEELRAKAPSNVLFVGPIPNDKVADYYRLCDVFVYPSRSGEGIPRAILEAMACGRPVVATIVAGTPEAVKHGETGLLVKPGDVEGLADAIKALLNDEVKREDMGLRARRHIEESFSMDNFICRLVECFKEVLGH